jgi:hypothetical protein
MVLSAKVEKASMASNGLSRKITPTAETSAARGTCKWPRDVSETVCGVSGASRLPSAGLVSSVFAGSCLGVVVNSVVDDPVMSATAGSLHPPCAMAKAGEEAGTISWPNRKQHSPYVTPVPISCSRGAVHPLSFSLTMMIAGKGFIGGWLSISRRELDPSQGRQPDADAGMVSCCSRVCQGRWQGGRVGPLSVFMMHRARGSNRAWDTWQSGRKCLFIGSISHW